MSLEPSDPAASGAVDSGPQLCVLVSCHQVVCALPIPSIDRLTLPEAAQRLVVPSRSAEPVAGSADPLPAVVQVGDERFAAWDLGLMLGLRPLAKAWILLRVSHGGKDVPIALRTGACLAVQSVRKLMRLPPGIFRGRRGAVTAGFAAGATKGAARFQAAVGLWLDPARLWEGQELQASAAALARAVGVAAPSGRSQSS